MARSVSDGNNSADRGYSHLQQHARPRNFFSYACSGQRQFSTVSFSGLGYGLGLGFWVVITIIVSLTLTITLITTLTVILP